MDDLEVARWHGFPVSPGHLLIVPRRHAATWDELTQGEKQAVWECVDKAKAVIQSRHQPDGFNVGFNLGAAAGQTVFIFICMSSPATAATSQIRAIWFGMSSRQRGTI